jgi:hypothetical protein
MDWNVQEVNGYCLAAAVLSVLLVIGISQHGCHMIVFTDGCLVINSDIAGQSEMSATLNCLNE